GALMRRPDVPICASSWAVGALFGRDVMYCDRDCGWAGIARSCVVVIVVQRRVVRRPMHASNDIVGLPSHRRQGVTARLSGCVPTGISVGFLVLVLTSIVDTVSLCTLATKTVLPSGVTATPFGYLPTGMSARSLALVVASIVDTVSLNRLATKTVL